MSWPLRPLSTLATFNNGFAFKPEDVSDSGRPIVRIRQLLDPQAPLDLFDGKVPSNVEIDTGDLIFSWSATLDCRYWNRGPALLNQHLFRVDPQPGVAKAWLRWAVLWAIGELRPYMHGSAMVHVTRPMLKLVKVPFPPLLEQRRIATFLDSEAERIESTSLTLGRPAALARESAATVLLLRMTEAGGSNQRLRFGVSKIEQGWSPECWDRPREESEWGVLKLGCVNGGVFTPAHKTLPDALEPRPTLEVKPGDLIVSRANTRALVGSAAVVAEVGPRLMLSDLLYRVTLRPDRWVPRFVASVLNSPIGRGQIEPAAAGASGSMPKISQEVLRQLRLPCPTIEDQSAIAAEQDILRQRESRLHRDAQRISRALASYQEAILREALSGRLSAALSDQQIEEAGRRTPVGRAPKVAA